MIKEFKEFKEGRRYLVNNEDHFLTNLKELTVLEISQIAIKVKWSEGSTEWIAKDRFFFRLKEELPYTKQTIEDRSHEIQFHDELLYEKDEPQFTLKLTEENDGEIILKAEEKPKLEWESNPPETPMNWDETREYPNSLGVGWRLPIIEELEEAYNNKVEGFTNFNYWSSSLQDTQDDTFIWCFNFFFGYADYISRGSKYNVRCVREEK